MIGLGINLGIDTVIGGEGGPLDVLLQEDGFALLQEDGGYILI